MREEYDFLQDKVNFLQDKVNELKAEKKLIKDQNKQLLAAHDVLIEKRNELLEKNEELREKLEFFEQGQPHPCTFDGKRWTSEYTLRDWLNKLKEEVAEVEVETEKLGANVVQSDIDKLDREGKADCLVNLVEECTDVITVATSILDWVGLSVYGRCQRQKGVNEKNKRRGYWE